MSVSYRSFSLLCVRRDVVVRYLRHETYHFLCHSVFTASDLPQLTMSPVPVVGTNGSLSVGSGVMQTGVNNVGQTMAVDPSQGNRPFSLTIAGRQKLVTLGVLSRLEGSSTMTKIVSSFRNRSSFRRYGRKHWNTQSSQRYLQGEPPRRVGGRRRSSPPPSSALPPPPARKLRHRLCR